MIHFLKCHPHYFALSDLGRKHFEIRLFDRPFELRDFVCLMEWDPAKKDFTGAILRRSICAILNPDDVIPELNAHRILLLDNGPYGLASRSVFDSALWAPAVRKPYERLTNHFVYNDPVGRVRRVWDMQIAEPEESAAAW